MSAGGMHCRTSSTGGVLLYVAAPEVRQTAQMCHTSTPFGHFTNPHFALPMSPLHLPGVFSSLSLRPYLHVTSNGLRSTRRWYRLRG